MRGNGSATLAVRRTKRATAVVENCPICREVHDESDASVFRGLAETPKKLERLLRGLTAKGFDWNYGPGKWSIRQLVCHLRDCELNFSLRWRKLVSEENVALAAFEQDHWARLTRYAKQDGKLALAAFLALRVSNLEMLKLAGAAAYGNVGTHPSYGRLSARQIFRHVLFHDRRHLDQIASARHAKRNHGAWK
jgi:hypothetical protein